MQKGFDVKSQDAQYVVKRMYNAINQMYIAIQLVEKENRPITEIKKYVDISVGVILAVSETLSHEILTSEEEEERI